MPSEIREAGRWQSESSFRIYLDVIGALAVGQQLKLAGFEQVIPWLRNNLALYFNSETLDSYGVHGRPTRGKANQHSRRQGQHAESSARQRGAGRGSSSRTRLGGGASAQAATATEPQVRGRGRGIGGRGRLGRR